MKSTRHLAILAGTLMCLSAISSPVATAEEQPATGQQPATTATETTPATTGEATTPATAPQPGDDKIVCKTEPAPVGSRIGAKKKCKSVADWRREEEAAKAAVQEIQSRKMEPTGS